jgi:hypothetical protein
VEGPIRYAVFARDGESDRVSVGDRQSSLARATLSARTSGSFRRQADLWPPP